MKDILLTTDNKSVTISYFINILVSAKKALFGIFYMSIKEDSPSLIHIYIGEILELFQLLLFSFHTLLNQSWNNNSLSIGIMNIFNKFDLIYYTQISSSPLNTYISILYSLFSFLVIIIILMIYINYLFKKSILKENPLISVFRICLRYISSFLFIPFLKFFLIITSCLPSNSNSISNSNNIFYYSYISDSIVCFKSFYFLHLFISIVCIIFLILLVSIYTSIYYDSLIINDSYLSKLNSNSTYSLFISKIVLCIMFTYLNNNESSFLLIVFQFFISLLVFYSNYSNYFIKNKSLFIFLYIKNLIWLWTTSLLLFSEIINMNQYSGILYLWMIGIPFCIIISVLYYNSSIKKEIVYMHTLDYFHLSFENYSETTIQIRIIHLIYMIDNYKQREYELIIKGFIINHIKICQSDDCPLKTLKKNQNNINSYIIDSSNIEHMKNCLYSFISKVIYSAIEYYESSISLKILYSLFLYNYQKQKIRAKQELDKAEIENCSLNLQFLIFRYKKLISDDLDMNINQINNNEIIDIATLIAYESHLKECQLDIISVGKLFIDFWSTLSIQNTSPNIEKLNFLTKRINEYIKNVHNHWKYLQGYKQNNPKAIKIYALFYIEILNNREKGKQIMSLLKEANNEFYNYDFGSSEDDFSNEQCLIVCSAEKDNYGSIVKASANTSKIFCYIIDDLYGKSINDLFIDCYNIKINIFFQKLCTILELIRSSELTPLNEKKEYVLYIKTKLFRTIPVYVKIHNPSFLIGDKYHFSLLIRPYDNINEDLKEYNRKGYIIINSLMNIVILSDSTLQLFSLKYNNQIPESNNLGLLLPELIKNNDKNNKEVYYDSNSMNFKIFDSILYDILKENKHNTNNIQNSITHITQSKSVNNSLSNNNNSNNDDYYDFEIYCLNPENDQFEEPLNLKIGAEHLTINDYLPKNKNQNEDMNVTINKDNDEEYYAIKIEYCLKSSSNNYLLQTKKSKKNQENLNNDFYAFSDTRFNRNMIETCKLSLNYNKIIKKIENIENQNIMTYIKGENTFCELFQWEGLDPNRFNKEANNQKLNKDNEKNNAKYDENSINSSPKTNFFKDYLKNSDDKDDINKGFKVNLHYDSNISDDEEEEYEEEDNEVEEDEEADDILRLEAEIQFKKEELIDKIKSMKNYSKSVKMYLMKNDCDPKEEFISPKINEYITQINLNNITNIELNDMFTQKDNSELPASLIKENNKNYEENIPVLNRLNIASIIIIIVYVLYSIIEILINNNNKNLIDLNINLSFLSNRLLNEIVWSSFLLRNLKNREILYQSTSTSNSTFIKKEIEKLDSFGIPTKEEILNLLNNSTDIQSTLLDDINIKINKIKLSSSHYNLYFTETVKMFESDGTFSYKHFLTACNRVRISLLSIKNFNSFGNNYINEINTTLYNIFNDFFLSLKENSNQFSSLLIDNAYYSIKVFIILYSILYLISISCIIIIYKLLKDVVKEKNKILISFYEIPLSYINKLLDKCVRYVDKYELLYQNEENEKEIKKNTEKDKDTSANSNLDNDDDEESYHIKGNKKRITFIKQTISNKDNYFIKIIFTYILIISIFTINFSRNIITYQNITILFGIFNNTSILESMFGFGFNLSNEKIINKTMIAFSNITNIELVKISINDLYVLNSFLITDNIEKSYFFSEDYNLRIKNILYSDYCNSNRTISNKENILFCNKSLTNITSFNNSNVSNIPLEYTQYGLSIIIMNFIRNLNFIYENYLLMDSNNNNEIKLEIISSSNQYQYFLRPLFQEISYLLYSEIQNYLDTELNIRLIIFILFIVLYLSSTFLVWLPFQNSYKDEIIRTKKMLEILPEFILEGMDSLNKKENE